VKLHTLWRLTTGYDLFGLQVTTQKLLSGLPLTRIMAKERGIMI